MRIPRNRPAIFATVATVIGAVSVGATAAEAPRAASSPGQVLLAQTEEQMPPQMRTALIRALQEELNARGYGAGPVDGVTGPRTRAAIRSYQNDSGLRVTGQPSKELLDHIKFSSDAAVRGSGGATAAPGPGLPAEAGPELIRSVQRELQVRGYYRGAIDGIAGPNTAAGIRAFQRDAGFAATGTVDERLLSELRVADPNIRAGR